MSKGGFEFDSDKPGFRWETCPFLTQTSPDRISNECPATKHLRRIRVLSRLDDRRGHGPRKARRSYSGRRHPELIAESESGYLVNRGATTAMADRILALLDN